MQDMANEIRDKIFKSVREALRHDFLDNLGYQYRKIWPREEGHVPFHTYPFVFLRVSTETRMSYRGDIEFVWDMNCDYFNEP